MKTNDKTTKSGAILIPKPWRTKDFRINEAGENYYKVDMISKKEQKLRFLPAFNDLESFLPSTFDPLDFEPYFDVNNDAMCWLVHGSINEKKQEILLFADGKSEIR